MKYVKLFERKNFLMKLLNNLCSLDLDDRSLTKLVIHKLYSCSFKIRNLFLKILQNCLIDWAHDSPQLSDLAGIKEILCLMSILNLIKIVFIKVLKFQLIHK